MFYLLLGLNGWTDWQEGFVYDLWSLLLFLVSLLNTWGDWSLHSLGLLLFLVILRIYDQKEELLGRGDYLILLSVSMYMGDALPIVLLVTSFAAQVSAKLTGKRQIPLVPYLWLGCVLVGGWNYLL